jgi:hypothetical protein
MRRSPANGLQYYTAELYWLQPSRSNALNTEGQKKKKSDNQIQTAKHFCSQKENFEIYEVDFIASAS